MTENGTRPVGLDVPAGAAAPAGSGSGSETQLTLGLLLRLFTATADGPSRAGDASAGTAREELTAEVHSIESFERKLDLAQELGLTEIEITQAGDPSGADFLVAHPAARTRFVAAVESRGLRVAALNCSGMPLHPVYGERHRLLMHQTFVLAEELGVEKVVTMSGVGGDGRDATTINWAFFPWPPSSVALAEHQWDNALALWEELTEDAAYHGVRRIALELHPLHLVYNVPTLERFRDRLGPIIGATVDPSHLIWQYMDPSAVVEALGDALFHVHLKDTAFVSEELDVAGVLDDRPFGGPRAWAQRTIGRGHDSEWWRRFLGSLVRHGYSGAAVIENEDPDQTYEDGVREAAAFLFPLIEEQVHLFQSTR